MRTNLVPYAQGARGFRRYGNRNPFAASRLAGLGDDPTPAQSDSGQMPFWEMAWLAVGLFYGAKILFGFGKK